VRFAFAGIDFLGDVFLTLVDRGWEPVKLFTRSCDNVYDFNDVTVTRARNLRLPIQMSRIRSADLAGLKAMLADSTDLTRLIKSPAFSREEQGRALHAVLERAGIGELTRRFVGLTARNRRVFALPAMIDAYAALLARAKGEVTATAVSAQPLSEAQLAQIRDLLAAKAKRQVSLSANVDPSLIGGLVVRMGSRMIDSSLKTKLQSLELAMKGVG